MAVLGQWALVGLKEMCICACVCVCTCAYKWGEGGLLLRASRVLFASPERPTGEILSGACLSRCFPHSACSIARKWVRGETYDYVCVYVCVSRGPVLSALRCFDCHDIMCLNTVTPSPHLTHTHTHPLSAFYFFFKGSAHQQGPLFCECRIFGFSSVPPFPPTPTPKTPTLTAFSLAYVFHFD